MRMEIGRWEWDGNGKKWETSQNWEWKWEGMGIESMGMGRDWNVKSHSRPSLVPIRPLTGALTLDFTGDFGLPTL